MNITENDRCTLTKTFAEVTAFSGIACASECMLSGRCFVANYNSATMACTMIRDASTFVNDVNWDSFIVEIGMLSCVLYANVLEILIRTT